MEPISTIDPVADDPATPDGDGAGAPSSVELTLVSAGLRLLNVALLPAGPGPHPVVVLLHGFPGHDTWQDLAHVLRRAGYATVTFHYRGSWGSPGAWSWSAALDDARAVVATLREDRRFDPARVSVLGHSFGGFVALQAFAADLGLRAAASIAGFDFGVAQDDVSAEADGRSRYERMWGEMLTPLQGTSAPALVEEMVAAGDRWSLPTLAPRLAGRDVLLVGTGRDPVAPAERHHAPVAAAFRAHGVRLAETVLPTDHALSDHRVRLARRVLGFLASLDRP